MYEKKEVKVCAYLFLFPPGITMKPDEHSGFSQTFKELPPNTHFETLHPIIGIKGIFKRLDVDHPDFGWNAVWISDGCDARHEFVKINEDHLVEPL